jgi:hypothetical protein
VKQVAKIDFPAESRLYARLGDASFDDAFETELADPSLNAIEIALRVLAATPAWVEALLHVRNRAVALVGLKDVGALGALDGRPAAAYRVGDRLSLFEVLSISPDELVLGIDDHHLDVRISFLKRRKGERSTYALSSWVKTHNALGRLYMIPVGRIHPIIVRTAMRTVIL